MDFWLGTRVDINIFEEKSMHLYGVCSFFCKHSDWNRGMIRLVMKFAIICFVLSKLFVFLIYLIDIASKQLDGHDISFCV